MKHKNSTNTSIQELKLRNLRNKKITTYVPEKATIPAVNKPPNWAIKWYFSSINYQRTQTRETEKEEKAYNVGIFGTRSRNKSSSVNQMVKRSRLPHLNKQKPKLSQTNQTTNAKAIEFSNNFKNLNLFVRRVFWFKDMSAISSQTKSSHT